MPSHVGTADHILSSPPARADGVALFLDMDGVLAPLAPTPDAVRPVARRTAVLKALETRLEGRVAIVSGRTIAEIDGIERIRFTTSHPLEFSDSLVEAYRDVPQLANYLHLPVQSGSDRILSAMKRGYTALEFKQKIRKLRAVRPDISISSDFIVGFPGETDADFEKTMKLIEDVGFDQSFSFIYSRRPGTPAADLEDSVSSEVKHARLSRLQAHINEYSAGISRAMVGSVQKVLVTGPSRRNPEELTGKTENMRALIPARARRPKRVRKLPATPILASVAEEAPAPEAPADDA